MNCGFYQENGDVYQHMGLLMVNGESWAELRSNWVKGDASSGGGDLRMGHTQVLLWVVYRLP